MCKNWKILPKISHFSQISHLKGSTADKYIEIIQRKVVKDMERVCPNGRACNGMEDGMEEEFWYGIWKTSGMERNGRF